MKKLLLALALSALLALGCAGGNQTRDIPSPTNLQLDKPAYVLHIEDLYPNVDIIRWENDGETMWLWVDNKDQPMQCDYVVVYRIIDLEKDLVDFLALFNFENSADPCGEAVAHYEEYMSIMENFPGSQLLPKANEI